MRYTLLASAAILGVLIAGSALAADPVVKDVVIMDVVVKDGGGYVVTDKGSFSLPDEDSIVKMDGLGYKELEEKLILTATWEAKLYLQDGIVVGVVSPDRGVKCLPYYEMRKE